MSPSEQARWFSEEVKPYERALRAYLSRRFPTLPDHDDLVQEAYTRLLRARQNGRLTYIKALLFTAARNVAIDMFRRRRLIGYVALSDVSELRVLEETPGVVETLEREQRHAVLIEAVASLPERCRAVMMLSYKEIAERLGISPETVKVHMLKGVRDCTSFFKARGLIQHVSIAASRRYEDRAVS
jgi:RNA polymerase sigma factor (sigma-70 family)